VPLAFIALITDDRKCNETELVLIISAHAKGAFIRDPYGNTVLQNEFEGSTVVYPAHVSLHRDKHDFGRNCLSELA
jgi:hypothetical protein